MTIESIIRIAADGAVYPIVLIAIFALIFYVPKGGRYEAYSRVLMAGLTALLLAKLIAFTYQPEGLRPFQEMGVEPGASFMNNPGFPSDHTLFTVAITLAVWFETRRKSLTVVLIVLTALVMAGRVLALVHTPLDVIGGVVIASMGALWYLQDGPTRKIVNRRRSLQK